MLIRTESIAKLVQKEAYFTREHDMHALIR